MSMSAAGNGRKYDYIILGGGNAAGYAARQFVEKHGVAPHSLAIVSAEAVAPYERPALSKAFLAPESPARLPGFHTCVGAGGERQLPEWYEKHGVDLLLSTEIVRADVKQKTLTARDGQQMQYDKLMVAVGSGVVRLSDFGTPGADLGGIHYLREVADAERLYAAMKEAANQEAVVIGGGYIGMECAAALANNRLKVTMVFPEEHVMPRLFTPAIAQHYEKAYRDRGIKFVKGTLAQSLSDADGNGRVTHVHLKDGTVLPARLVMVGVGARPRSELFKDSLEQELGGIKVNAQLQASDPSVFCVGDMAAFPLKMYGNRMTRVEHVGHARESAMHAADVMAGARHDAYDYLPFFYSRVFNLSWKFWGDTPKDAKTIVAGTMDPKLAAVWIDQDSKVVGTFIESGTEAEEKKLKALARHPHKVDAAAVEAAATKGGVAGLLDALPNVESVSA